MEGFVLSKVLELLKGIVMQEIGIQYPDWLQNRGEIWFSYKHEDYRITIEKVKGE